MSDLWVALVLTGGAVEAWALRGKHRDATASHFIRVVFRTDSPAGRLVFRLGCAALPAWLVPHILSERERP